MDSPRPVGPGRRRSWSTRSPALGRRAVQVLRRLDRPHRPGRAAAQQPAAAAGRRAQHRRHDVGVGRPEEVPARPDLDRSALSHGQRLRPALRLAGVRDRHAADPRSEDEHGHDLHRARCATPTRRRPLGPGHAASPRPMAPSPYWGDEKIWDTRANNHNSMFDRKGRVWLTATVRGGRQPGLLQEGLRPSLGEALPDRAGEPAARDARSRRR